MGSSHGEPGRPHAGPPSLPGLLRGRGQPGAVLGGPKVTPPTPQPRGSARKPCTPSLARVKGPLLVAWMNCWRSRVGSHTSPRPRPAGCLSRPDEPPSRWDAFVNSAFPEEGTPLYPCLLVSGATRRDASKARGLSFREEGAVALPVIRHGRPAVGQGRPPLQPCRCKSSQPVRVAPPPREPGG